MKKTKKVYLIKRMKDSIVNFDKYLSFSEEKLSIAIKYILKLVLLFTILTTIALSLTIVQQISNMVIALKNEVPEFNFQNNELIIEGDNQKIVKSGENGYFGVIIDAQNNNLKDIQEAADYQKVIGILKDRVVIKENGRENALLYDQIAQDYDLSSINKNTILQFFNGDNITKIYSSFGIIVFIYFFILYLLQFFLDILLLSVVGYLVSKIAGVKFKYKSIFSMSTFAMTLSIVLYAIYIIVNIFTGFTIKYFEIAYNAIAYIYIITAILTIKSDLIKQKIEVEKIVEEQKKVREENKEKEEKEQKDNKEEKSKKEKKEKKEEKQEEGTPEGNQV